MTRGYLIGYNLNYFYTAELNIFHWKWMVGVCVGEGELNGVGSCIMAPLNIPLAIPSSFSAQKDGDEEEQNLEGGKECGV